MWISRYFFLFIVYSFLGWVYETAYCTVRDGRWENRGFLYGPVCPIYGSGAVLGVILTDALSLPEGTGGILPVFLLSLFGSAALEFGASWVLEKLFHAVWWDYSRLPLNLQGRISLFTSIGFGLAGVLIVYVIAPFTERVTGGVPPIWLEALSLLFMAVFAADLTLTVSALTDFAAAVTRLEDSLNGRMGAFVATARRSAGGAKTRLMTEREHISARLSSFSPLRRRAVRRVRALRYPKIAPARLNAIRSVLEEKLRQRGK